MKTNLWKVLAFGLSTLTLLSCDKEDELSTMGDNLTKDATAETCDVIDFNQYETGFITQVTSMNGIGPVAVYNKARNAEGNLLEENKAMIFDTHAPTGDDDDLYTGEGSDNGALLQKALIINEPALTIPDDNAKGGTMTLDFSAIGTVTLQSMKVVDIDEYENDSYVRLYNAAGTELYAVKLKNLGNNTVQDVNLGNTAGVTKMIVTLAGTEGYVGSGAIDDIRFCKNETTTTPTTPPTEEEVYGCTRTQGYWKNHASGKKYDSTWGGMQNEMFYGSGMTYLKLMETAPKGGNAYVMLAHQYIAAKLNMKVASSPAEVDEAYEKATAYFAAMKDGKYLNTLQTPYVTVSRDQLVKWAELLDKYNNGLLGPAHCN
ncbi:hypothetical protein [Pontibacter ruber]|uniref:Uncharacterized protein n=1 Tax=Pontibacter ruber TaxID=1343895 RepID=A0ABW5D1K1_9BACT|nr:hypothetical protein [Pontibacter ruber]